VNFSRRKATTHISGVNCTQITFDQCCRVSHDLSSEFLFITHMEKNCCNILAVFIQLTKNLDQSPTSVRPAP